MKRLLKATAFLLSLILTLSLLAACGNAPTAPEIPEATAAPAIAGTPILVTIEADGRHYTFEDATGLEVRQLLDQAGITLNEGDTLAFAPEQAFPGDVAFQVIRQHTVTVVSVDSETNRNIRHKAVLMEGTVADAIAAVGVELAANTFVNFELNTPLADGMEIIVSGEMLPQDFTTLTPTDPVEGATPTEPTTQTGRTIVSIEVYEDCDGSGHGIKIITYSDGTQEEVLF